MVRRGGEDAEVKGGRHHLDELDQGGKEIAELVQVLAKVSCRNEGERGEKDDEHQ